MPNVTLRDLVRRELGAETFVDVNRVVSSIGVAAVQIMRQQPNRLAFVVVNLSPNDIHIGPFRDVSSSKGILLPPSGGSVVSIYTEDFDLVGYEWFGIAAAAASAILVVEWLTQREP